MWLGHYSVKGRVERICGAQSRFSCYELRTRTNFFCCPKSIVVKWRGSRCSGPVGVAFPLSIRLAGIKVEGYRGVAEAHAPFLLGRALARVQLDHLPVQHYPQRRLARSRHFS